LKKVEYYNTEDQKRRNIGKYIGKCLENQIDELNNRRKEEERLKEIEKKYNVNK